MVGPLIAAGLYFAAAYDRRSATEAAVNAQMARLAGWNARADAWERWAESTGGSIPPSFFAELDAITGEPGS